MVATKRADVTALGEGFYQIILHYGVYGRGRRAQGLGPTGPEKLRIDPDSVTYFLGRETLFATERPGMAIWRENLFIVLSKTPAAPASFFCIPPDRVIEIGVQVEL